MDAWTQRKAGLEPDYVPENPLPWKELLAVLVFGLISLSVAGFILLYVSEMVGSW